MTDGSGAPGEGQPSEAGPAANPAPSRPAPRRLRLTDPLVSRATEDNPESWGDREPDPDPAARYARERPPHHGS